jgi:hypothetical protein
MEISAAELYISTRGAVRRLRYQAATPQVALWTGAYTGACNSGDKILCIYGSAQGYPGGPWTATVSDSTKAHTALGRASFASQPLALTKKNAPASKTEGIWADSPLIGWSKLFESSVAQGSTVSCVLRLPFPFGPFGAYAGFFFFGPFACLLRGPFY